MKLPILVVSAVLLLGIICVVFALHSNRYEILAQSDLRRFVESNRHDLYASYPYIIQEIADQPELAVRVSTVHLFVSDFTTTEFSGQDFASLARLPNIDTIECTYSHNADSLVPTLNSVDKLTNLNLYYCDPVAPILAQLQSDSLRSIQVHSFSPLDIPQDVLHSFAQRMPNCNLHFSTDREYQQN